jgi:hypothetical protein
VSERATPKRFAAPEEGVCEQELRDFWAPHTAKYVRGFSTASNAGVDNPAVSSAAVVVVVMTAVSPCCGQFAAACCFLQVKLP